MSGTMGFHEFKELCHVLSSWKTTFSSYDQDHSGAVEAPELQKAIAFLGTAAPRRHPHPHPGGESVLREEEPLVVTSELCTGYNLSPQAMNAIMKRFSANGSITFDDFITCCVKLRALTGE